MCLGEEATAATEAETDYEVFLIFRRRMRTAEEEKKITSAAADVQMGA